MSAPTASNSQKLTEPIIGNLAIEASDGTTLTAPSDIRLAWAWAEHEITVSGENWETLPYSQKCAHVSAALAELRRAYSES